ncbi:MAG: superoxide dismutase [Alphaproteobacteria bacterium]|nr:superoxide dismutase [Alphaproteobacteria bacterium]
MTFELPKLPYAYDALSPYMSAETLEYHHDKHHKAYVDKGNELAEKAGMGGKSLEEVVVASFKDKSQQALFNNAGQHWNHIHFWNWMAPKGGGRKMPGTLEKSITESFGDFDTFRGKFIEAGMTQFGSGWAWLVLGPNGKLEIMKTPNGENPLAHGKTAILGADVWEHSYYIDYRNARQKYLEAFVDNLVNWEHVAEMFEKGPLKVAA